MQNVFIRCRDPQRVVNALGSGKAGSLDRLSVPKRWPGEPRYPTTLKVSPRRLNLDESPDFPRYLATKRSDGGKRLRFQWLLVADEHDRVDPRLAGYLSRQFNTVALATHGSDGTDEYGWGSYDRGMLVDQHFREMEERPVYRITEELELRGIPFRMCPYRDCSGPGWRTVAFNGLR